MRSDRVQRLRQALVPPPRTRLGLLFRAGLRYVDDGMTERAPAIAYYGILSIFPCLLLGVALLRLFGGDGAPDDLATFARDHGSSGAVSSAIRSAADTARDAPAPTAGAIGALGIATLIYGASRAFTATGRAIDAMGSGLRVPRSLWRRAEDIAWSTLLVVLAFVALALVTISGSLIEDLLGVVGLPSVTVWSIVRLPVAAALTLIIVATVYWAAPSGSKGRFRPVTPGALVAVAVLAVETAGFNVYVSTFASYNATYGASAGIVILLLWIWLAGTALLYGAELDSVLAERDR